MSDNGSGTPEAEVRPITEADAQRISALAKRIADAVRDFGERSDIVSAMAIIIGHELGAAETGLPDEMMLNHFASLVMAGMQNARNLREPVLGTPA